MRSPGSRACCFPACLGSLTTEDSAEARGVSLQPIWPSPSLNKVGALDWFFEARCPACQCLCLRFGFDLTINSARLEVRMDRVSFPVRLFHSRQHAGLSRRSQRHLNSLSFSCSPMASIGSLAPFNWKGTCDGDCCRFDNRSFSGKVRFAIAGRICRSMDLRFHGRLVHRDCAGRICP